MWKSRLALGWGTPATAALARQEPAHGVCKPRALLKGERKTQVFPLAADGRTDVLVSEPKAFIGIWGFLSRLKVRAEQLKQHGTSHLWIE